MTNIVVFSIFSAILSFLKVEATFSCNGNAFFNKSNPSSSQWKRTFCLVETVFFFIRAIFLLVESIIGIKWETTFKERAYSYQCTTGFLASGNYFPLYFSEIPASDSLFSVQWKQCFKKILHSSQWKRILEKEKL